MRRSGEDWKWSPMTPSNSHTAKYTHTLGVYCPAQIEVHGSRPPIGALETVAKVNVSGRVRGLHAGFSFPPLLPLQATLRSQPAKVVFWRLHRIWSVRVCLTVLGPRLSWLAVHWSGHPSFDIEPLALAPDEPFCYNTTIISVERRCKPSGGGVVKHGC